MDETEIMENQENIPESDETGETIPETTTNDLGQIVAITEAIRVDIHDTNGLICLSLGLIIGIMIIRMVLSK